MDEPLRDELRAYYDQDVARRDDGAYPAWKVTERAAFLARLRAEGRRSLLEIGAGTGRDALFFQERGLTVTCVDYSPAMVAACRAKGLDARVMDFWRPTLPPASFDALYALNCLLHVPTTELAGALERLSDLLPPGGLFYLGVYGGVAREGRFARGPEQAPRFFAYHTDDFLRAAVAPWFTEVAFAAVAIGEADYHFQSLTLRRRPARDE